MSVLRQSWGTVLVPHRRTDCAFGTLACGFVVGTLGFAIVVGTLSFVCDKF